MFASCCGVRAGGAGGEKHTPKILICQKFGQNLKNLGKKCFDIF